MKHGCYELKLVSMDREQLIAKIQNQRIEINNMHETQRHMLDHALEQGCRIRAAIKELNDKHYITALSILRNRVTDGDALLREKANG